MQATVASPLSVTALLILLFVGMVFADVADRNPERAKQEKARITQAEAATIAGRWWGNHYRGDVHAGAAFVVESDGTWRGRYAVGVCDGLADNAGKGGSVEGQSGAYFNRQWEAKYQSPSGKWYKNATWFGQGNTWEEALYDSFSKGYGPGRWSEVEKFCTRIGKPIPWKREEFTERED